MMPFHMIYQLKARLSVLSDIKSANKGGKEKLLNPERARPDIRHVSLSFQVFLLTSYG
jgi:hypothetical protein